MQNRTSGQRQIVVVTTEGDAHLDYIQPHLDSPLIVIDPLTLQESKTLSYELDTYSHKIVVSHNGVKLDRVSSVWVRKPQAIKKDSLPLNAAYRGYAVAALMAHFKQLFTALPDALWVSDWYNLDSANNKSHQLALASKLGFQVPDSILTSDKAAAHAFIARHNKVLMKSMPHFFVEIEGQHKVMFATLIDKQKLPALDNLYLSPLIFQEAIDTAFDVRVIVVGDHVFPARINAESTGNAVRDYRIGSYEGDLDIEVLDDFPKDIADLCVQHTKELGLQFGAIDLVVDNKGTYWFLENNPNGQWGFIERCTGQQIGKVFAKMLQDGKKG